MFYQWLGTAVDLDSSEFIGPETLGREMKLQIFSDIHVEFSPNHRFRIPDHDSDLVVLCGDIGPGLSGLAWAEREMNRLGTQVLYVPGNHEFYGREYFSHLDRMRRRAEKIGIIFLSDDVYERDGYRFIGSTLWTSFLDNNGATDEEAIWHANHRMPDFSEIKFGRNPFTPRDAQELYLDSIGFIESQFLGGEKDKTVVITHHGPSHECVNPKFPFRPLSRCFTSDAENLLGRSALWAYGHTHASLDFRLGGTRLISNQRGYPAESGCGFDPDLLVEV